jgi:hypothetical protein
VGVGDWATLLPGVAAVFTALSGPAVAVYAIRRGSKRERKSAARGALDRVFGGDDDEDEDRYEAVTKLLEELHRRRKDEQ